MLIDNTTLQGIVEGRISVVFRTWKRPTVKAGGTLRTRMGVLAIEKVEAIATREISVRDVKLAGFATRAELNRHLDGRVGTLYRIRVRAAGEDPRIALRAKVPTNTELADIDKRLQRMDAASRDGAWTGLYLALIHARPAQRAPELATLVGLETKQFKQRVRRLKELGLTESLPVGYRISARGQAYLTLEHKTSPPSAAGRRTIRKRSD